MVQDPCKSARKSGRSTCASIAEGLQIAEQQTEPEAFLESVSDFTDLLPRSTLWSTLFSKSVLSRRRLTDWSVAVSHANFPVAAIGWAAKETTPAPLMIDTTSRHTRSLRNITRIPKDIVVGCPKVVAEFWRRQFNTPRGDSQHGSWSDRHGTVQRDPALATSRRGTDPGIEGRKELSRYSTRKYLWAGAVERAFNFPNQPNKSGSFAEKLAAWLQTEAGRSRQRRSRCEDERTELGAGCANHLVTRSFRYPH